MFMRRKRHAEIVQQRELIWERHFGELVYNWESLLARHLSLKQKLKEQELLPHKEVTRLREHNKKLVARINYLENKKRNT